uniref:Variant surface glycoprotein (VSG), putative n=1 Tax=Trypanosoma brucei TaxID=5691 RepID=Q57WM7_9TRYP|nr:variant surface glycoprotein (VSG), putative [Trypanosoma brucei]
MRKTMLQLKAVLLSAAILLASEKRMADANGGMGLQPLGWKHLCTTSDELSDLTGEVVEATQGIISKIEQFSKESLMAEIYLFAAAKPDEQEKTAALAGYLATKALSGLGQYKSETVLNNLDAAAAGAYLKGHIDEFLTIASGTAQGSSGGCIISSDSGVQLTGTVAGTTCPRKLPAVKVNKRSNPKIKATGVQDSPATTNSGTEHQDDEKACKLFDPTTGGIGSGGAISQPIPLAGGYYTIPATNKDPLTVADTSHVSKLTDTAQHPWHRALTALGKLHTADTEAYSNDTKTLQTSTEFSDLIGRIFGNKASQDQTQTKPKRESMFTDNSERPAFQLLAKIHDYQIPTAAAGIPAKTALGTITDPTQLQALLQHYILAALKETAILKNRLDQATKVATKADGNEVCHKITNVSECNNKPFCSYNESAAEGDKQCKFNEIKASKNGVPVTQTQTVGTQTSKEKCKGKLEPECTKTPESKWENNACKDSSILVTKKFALSVVSAAFAALLF